MRPASTPAPSPAERTGDRQRQSRAQARRRRLALEGLEPRALMAVLPSPAVLRQADISGDGANDFNPTIAVDPSDARHLVAAWSMHAPAAGGNPESFDVGLAVSKDGGVTWAPLGTPSRLPDPTTSNPVVAYARATDAGVAFDRFGNVVFVEAQHNADNTSGAIVLATNGSASGRVLDQWVGGQDRAVSPTVAVDDNADRFVDPTTGAVQADPYAGNIYVSWVTDVTILPAPSTPTPKRVTIVASSDGGSSFTTPRVVQATGQNAQPRLAISQGTADGRVQPGQVTLAWDDFTNASAPSNPTSSIDVNRILDGAAGAVARGGGGLLGDAAANPVAGQPDVPTTTSFTRTVDITDPKFAALTDLDVTVDLVHPALAEVRLELVAPDGQRIRLMQAGSATGANLGGPTASGAFLGTVFDSQAPRVIGATGYSAPYIGHFAPAELPAALSAFNGRSAADLNGTWKLEVTDVKVGNVGTLLDWSLNFTSGLTAAASQTVAVTKTLGSLTGPFPQRFAASPDQGIGPTPAIASDNTLGSFSPYQGRLYVAYTDHAPPVFDAAGGADVNPPDNTEIYLITSDDGGASWSGRVRVNDDVATRDGFSEASSRSGRPQFLPAVAVDRTTGSVAVSFLDARFDAARARVAEFLAVSIDGGRSFAPEVYANPSQVAFDAITGQVVPLGPLPDNQSAGNPHRDPSNFGRFTGLAFANGHVYPAWPANFNRGSIDNSNVVSLDIETADAATASGPRIIASTMGPVGEPGDAINGARDADGNPQARAFVVTFDRPVDPATFTAADVAVTYRDVGTPITRPGVGVPVRGVTPLDSGPFGATTFRVDFEPRSAVGTYSYRVGPDVSDRVRSAKTRVVPSGTTTVASTDVPIPIPDVTTITSTLTVGGIPAGQVLSDVNVTLSLRHTYDSDLILTLIAPDGTRVVLSDREGGSGDDFIDTTFDDQARTLIGLGSPPFTGTFIPDLPLSNLVGRDPNGTWRLEIADVAAIDVGTLESWSLTLQTGVVSRTVGPGNPMDQDADGLAGEVADDAYQAPRPVGASFDQDTLPLIVPGPHVAGSFVPGSPPTGDNLALNRTVAALDVTFDRAMDPATFTAADVLRVMGPSGLVAGPFTVTPDPQPGEDADFPRTYRIGFPAQQLSGTYTVVLGPEIRSRAGDPLDTNLNAGVDVLRGLSPTGQTTAVTVDSTDTPLAIPDATGPDTPGVTTSKITVTDDFVVQGLTLRLNITHANDPDLEATLIAPDGRRITLFRGVGQAGGQQGFSNTVFSDAADTPIASGGRPFFGTFNPQMPLGVLRGLPSAGTYLLEVRDNRPGGTGRLENWSLTFQKPVPGTGLGEPVADRATVSFRIFTMDPTNPLSSNTWTAVGPASIGGGTGGPAGGDGGSVGTAIRAADEGGAENGGRSGRIGGLAVDPSDPSGNTVYVGGASGGVWKTTDFLNPEGPTYIPLTDFGPTFAINIGGIAVFGRNNDPNQSIVFAATGEGDTASPGVGFLRSMDGGATWTLLDSTNNDPAIPFASRDHLFARNGGTQSFKVLVDPRPTPTGDVIVYAALSGGDGGIWRSLDTGRTWQNMKAGNATDLVFDPASGTGAPGGNLQTLYAAFRGDGIYITPNRGQVWNKLNGGVGDPLIHDLTTGGFPVPVTNTAPGSPGAGQGRIVLAKPELTGNPVQDLLYRGWLYALVVTPGVVAGKLNGLYLTKDFGQNWTKVRLNTIPPATIATIARAFAVPTNDYTKADYDPLAGPVGSGFEAGQGNYDVSLAIDPTNPNVVYVGGTLDGPPSGYLRVDVTGLADPHALVAYNNNAPDGGQLQIGTNAVGRITLDDPTNLPAPTPFLNLIRNPSDPFNAGATINVFNAARFNNQGYGARWIPFDIGGTDQHRVITMVDPVTRHARIIIGDDQGVFTAVDDDGTFVAGIGTAESPSGSRNGNLQITQFYYGAAQPSNLAAQVRGALFYGSAQDNGGPASAGDVLETGDLVWDGPGGDATGVATDQQGRGTLFQYWWPCCGGGSTDFFQVDGTGRTFGLLQQSNPGPVPDPQWPFTGGSNFAVNPLNGNQVIISSQAGRVFSTENQGRLWLVIGNPEALDGTYAPALAYGAPDPNGPGGIGNLDNFLYAGTSGGRIFVTQTGGGGSGNDWANISAGLDGSSVQAIITNPTRGSHEAYAVTSGGVYHIADSIAAGAAWTRITGNLFDLTRPAFGDAAAQGQQLAYLTSIVADWRYVIPDAAGPGTHPMLYVAGEAGVFRSTDNGATWAPFPAAPPVGLDSTPTPPGAGGGLPVAHVTDLDLALGNIDPTTGRPDVATGPNVLLASTYGRGSFAIRLAPIIFPTSLRLDPASDTGASSSDNVTSDATPIIDGLSEQSAFGNVVYITLIDATDPDNPRVVGGFDGNFGGPTAVAANQTDAAGRFRVAIDAGAYDAVNHSDDGTRILRVQATDQSGTRGNLATLSFLLDTTPPDAPAVPDLDAASDGGLSSTDNITNVNADLVFDLAVTPGEPATTAVYLFRDNVQVASRSGSGKVSDAGPLADGVHLYKARQIDLAGNASAFSDPALQVRIDTARPARPATPTLDPADDSGVPGDNITNVPRPHLVGTAEPASQVELIDTAGNVVGTALVAGNGRYSVQPTIDLADGTYTLQVRDRDVAGNVSDPSPRLTLTIKRSQLGAPTLALVPADDTGVPGDNITNKPQPRLAGTAQPGLSVQLIDVKGNLAGAGNVIAPAPGQAPIVVANDGTFTLQFPAALTDDVYQVAARVADAAGNTATSPTLTLTIIRSASGLPPTLALSPADDTGIKGDFTTVVRRPRFIGSTSPNAIVDLVDPLGNLLATTTASATGAYTAQLPSNLTDGTLRVQARLRDVAGNQGPPSGTLTVRIVSLPGDYDGDGQADVAVYDPASTLFFVRPSAGGAGRIFAYGPASGVNLPIGGDFDGDGRADAAVYNVATATTTVRPSGGSAERSFTFSNIQGAGVPIAGDYDGDFRTDLAVYDPVAARFTIATSGGDPVRTVDFGVPNGLGVPIAGDYDGDGKTDVAVYDPASALFFIRNSGGGGRIFLFGVPNGIGLPIAGDYDGDGKTDVAVYDPASALFFIRPSSGAPGRIFNFGVPNGEGIPLAGDYDGDGKTDVAVYDPASALFFIRPSSGAPGRIFNFGVPNGRGVPIPATVPARAATAASVGAAAGTSSGGGGSVRVASIDLGRQAAGLAATGQGRSRHAVRAAAHRHAPAQGRHRVADHDPAHGRRRHDG